MCLPMQFMLKAYLKLEHVCRRPMMPGVPIGSFETCPNMQVCAAGALIAILIKEGILALTPGLDTESSGDLLAIHSISELSLDGFLTVDPGSFQALQIFQVLNQFCSVFGLSSSKGVKDDYWTAERSLSKPSRSLLLSSACLT